MPDEGNNRTGSMTDEQIAALYHLGSLTESGRCGHDTTSQCLYEVGGTDNGITLFQMGATDADMKRFSVLPEWHSIILRECPISDVGLAHLGNQTRLRFLDIGQTEVTDLQPLRECLRLQQLWCFGLKGMTDQGAVALAGFQELRFLDLSFTGIGDTTLERLASLPELRILYLTRTKITDDGLRHIVRSPKLETLSLPWTGVTDQGMRHLYNSPNLQLVDLGDTEVSIQARIALRRERPGLRMVDHVCF